MLRELNIKNLAIIDDLTVKFDRGLNVLTGETGAGKSIIVDALGLALGDRAQSDLIKSGEKEASVQAYFELEQGPALPDIGIDISEGIMLRRTISHAGKSRAYINDTMVTLQTLAETGRALVDIHSQHEHQSLLSPDRQRQIIDSYGGHLAELRSVRELHAVVQTLRQEFTALTERIKERARRSDMLTFQINEIASANLKEGEQQSLEEERRILSNLSRLKDAGETAYSLLHGAEGACTEHLSTVISKLREMHAVDPEVGEALSMTEAAMPLLQDAAFALRSFRDRYDVDPGRIEEVDDRLECIRGLGKKYGDSIEAVLAYQKTAEEELHALQTSDERLQTLDADIRNRMVELTQAVLALSDKRKRTAKKIEGLLDRNIRDLAFSNARFKIEVKQETDDEGAYRITAQGMDRLAFLFSANAGEPMKPLAKVASGGELSRVMLALKSVLADVDDMPVLIFDEIDAGVGGRTAESVGKKLIMIAKKHQLLCITHLPQIASLAAHHLRIEKIQKDNRVSVSVQELSGDKRQDEIARMLSGTVTDISRRHAEELLEKTR